MSCDICFLYYGKNKTRFLRSAFTQTLQPVSFQPTTFVNTNCPPTICTFVVPTTNFHYIRWARMSRSVGHYNNWWWRRGKKWSHRNSANKWRWRVYMLGRIIPICTLPTWSNNSCRPVMLTICVCTSQEKHQNKKSKNR